MYASWSQRVGVYQLVLKDDKKELEPRHFNKEEKEAFDKTDLAEWQQWIINEAVERVPPGQGNFIPGATSSQPRCATSGW